MFSLLFHSHMRSANNTNTNFCPVFCVNNRNIHVVVQVYSCPPRVNKRTSIRSGKSYRWRRRNSIWPVSRLDFVSGRVRQISARVLLLRDENKTFNLVRSTLLAPQSQWKRRKKNVKGVRDLGLYQREFWFKNSQTLIKVEKIIKVQITIITTNKINSSLLL